jgi:hypothetical protein
MSINDKLINIRNKKNKNSIILKNERTNIVPDNKNVLDNSLLDNNEVDLKSLDDNSINMMNVNTIKKSSIKNNNNVNNKRNNENKNNEKINKKVIIDDYSEFDNIKSLNSMDNTLSDLISIIENEK